MPEVASRLSAAEPVNPGSLKLVANLPYQISAPLVMNLLVDFPQVKRLCFTVQSEVGQRIVASPGGKEFGPLGILSQTLACPRIIAAAPPQAFWPRPAVDSVLVRLDTVNSPFVDYAEARRFAVLVRKTFEHRRKTLRRAMGYVVDGPALARICESVEPSRRPETLSTDEWLEVFRLADEPS
jgi:16S rRNA (adenine1518-N6/adenine1519-N6)-dimethyltransferase